MVKELQDILQTLASNSGPAALATLVSVAGSSYRRPGARILLTASGSRTGSISGGCLEDDVVLRANAVLATGQAETIVYDTSSENDLVWGVGLGCHGIVHVLIEKVSPQATWLATLAENLRQRRPTSLAVTWQSSNPAELGTRLAEEPIAPPSVDVRVFREEVLPPVPLVIFGAGDDAQPLVNLAKELGWHVTVVDPRPAFATTARFPRADAVVVARPEDEIAQRVPFDRRTLAVVMTHRYVHDVPFLRQLLPLDLAYLGLLGPKQRAQRILDDLSTQKLNVTSEMRDRLHAPVGLDLGAANPPEVALSIVAEILAVLAGRDARPLRERQKPIHG